MSLEKNVCHVVGHEWDRYTGSGEPGRPKCKRCKTDFIDWVAKALGAEIRK